MRKKTTEPLDESLSTCVTSATMQKVLAIISALNVNKAWFVRMCVEEGVEKYTPMLEEKRKKEIEKLLGSIEEEDAE